MRHIWLCADDYGISTAVNIAIRDLVVRGRLNATSVMAMTPSFNRAEARALAMHALEWAPAGIAFVHAAVGFITVETELSAGEEASYGRDSGNYRCRGQQPDCPGGEPDRASG